MDSVWFSTPSDMEAAALDMSGTEARRSTTDPRVSEYDARPRGSRRLTLPTATGPGSNPKRIEVVIIHE